MGVVQKQQIPIGSFGSSLGGKKSERAYQMLRRAIILNHYPPGTSLREQTLAAEFECSQSTVREALLHLADDGLVDRRGYQGTMVTKTTLAEAAAMVRVRLLIERDVARRIAQNGLGASEDALNALIARMDDSHSEGDLVHAGETDRAFHSELATAAGVELVSPILQRCTLHIHRFTLGSVEVPREFFQESGVGAEHRKLLRALTTTDEARAEAAIVSHLRHVLSRWSPSLLKAVGKAAFSKSA